LGRCGGIRALSTDTGRPCRILKPAFRSSFTVITTGILVCRNFLSPHRSSFRFLQLT
jgi:hypothetical protein